ncbi:hypothetical protein, partial [Paraburkholderia caribensis]|uniref:hypothetical protein n=1 Tax=Paraburkholderia caribensis TaxID=75105 RepID=UPI0020901097
MNHTTLEIGQGVSTFKGMVGLAAFVFLLCTLSGTYLIVSTLSAHEWEVDHFGVAFSVIGSLFCIPMGIWFLSIFLTDFFGYTDALLRFDRTRRKVWMFVGTRTPIELDWDRITPVSQGVTPANTNVNTFRAVLLVDLDEQG